MQPEYVNLILYTPNSEVCVISNCFVIWIIAIPFISTFAFENKTAGLLLFYDPEFSGQV